MKVAVIQHKLCTHERMDLAALLALSEQASDEGASVIACPRLPDVASDARIYQAFIENVRNYAPGSLLLMPSVSGGRPDVPQPFTTPLGRTLALYGDECIDPRVLASAADEDVDAMVWQPAAETAAQAEAFLEFALEASLSLTGLVLITAVTGKARGLSRFGCSAIVRAGDILAEAGEGEEIVTAAVEPPGERAERTVRSRPNLPPILAQRLSQHSAEARAAVDAEASQGV